MIAALLWKEYREHRAAWLALAVLAVGLIVGLPIVFAADFDQRPESRDVFAILGVVLTWAYGMICGGMMLAGEREGGTEWFLDTLPGGRRRLWAGKCVAGLIFVGAYAVFVGGLVAMTAAVEGWQWVFGPLALAVAGLVGLGWGLYLSVYGRTVLWAIGLAIAAQLVVGQGLLVVGLVLITVVQFAVGEPLVVPWFVSFLCLAALVSPFSLSALAYARVDRDRLRGETAPTGRLADFRRRFAATLWLSARQMRGLTWVVLLISLALGLLTLVQPLVLWPLVTLGLGTACGVTCFLDEQAGPRRFLGDQRFPLGSIWGMKVGLRLLLLLAALFVATLPMFATLTIDYATNVRTMESEQVFSGRLFRSRIVSMAVSPGVLLFAPALTGFAVGMLSGLVFRKAFIAVMAGSVLALFAFGVWAPALIAGGVPGWQVFLVPMILLGAARLLMRAWASERLLSRRIIVSMTALVASCVLLLGLGVWYRVASIPETPNPEELDELLARLRESEKVETGQLIRSTLAAFRPRLHEWQKEQAANRLLPPGETRPSYDMQLEAVNSRGWPAEAADGQGLAGWLDRNFADDVWKPLDRLPGLPLGVVIDPRRIDYTSTLPELDSVSWIGQLLAARGLQMQQKGEPEVFVKHFEIALSLVRNLESDSPPRGIDTGHWIEGLMTRALEQWLAALDGRPDLLRRVGDALDRQVSGWKGTDRSRDLAEYLTARHTLDNPGVWLRGLTEIESATAIISEQHLVALVWQLPWEHERLARLLRRYFFEGIPVTDDSPMIPAWPRYEERCIRRDLDRRLKLGVARLRVALRHHQATTGKPATDLKQLVPASIAAIPLDPYDGKPFRYRLSAGDEIEGMPVLDKAGAPLTATRRVPAGQGILWSVGTDGRDDGGKVFGSNGGDLIFLVPLEKQK